MKVKICLDDIYPAYIIDEEYGLEEIELTIDEAEWIQNTKKEWEKTQLFLKEKVDQVKDAERVRDKEFYFVDVETGKLYTKARQVNTEWDIAEIDKARGKVKYAGSEYDSPFIATKLFTFEGDSKDESGLLKGWTPQLLLVKIDPRKKTIKFVAEESYELVELNKLQTQIQNKNDGYLHYTFK